MNADLFDLLWFLAKWAGLSLLALYVLWIFFLAVMKLRDIRDAGKMGGPIKYPAYTVLVIGYAWDAICNLGPMTLLLLELPRLTFDQGLRGFIKQSEWTVSARTKRWAKTDTWRGKISRTMRGDYLAMADLKGGHD